jgi:hypothetical protein
MSVMAKHIRSASALALCVAASTAGCGGGSEPVSYSAPVGINVKAKGDAVKAGVVAEDKNINTEIGNPYGAFVAAARQKLGRDPGRIDISAVDLRLGLTRGTTALEQVVTGRVDVLFVMNDTNNSFAVAHVENPMGGGPVKMSIDFQAGTVQAADFARLVSGAFKVALRAMAAPGFADKAKEADLQVTFEFAAFE